MARKRKGAGRWVRVTQAEYERTASTKRTVDTFHYNPTNKSRYAYIGRSISHEVWRPARKAVNRHG